jgi:hypothetical protein
MDLQQIVDELRERVAKLETVQPRRRVYNQAQGAVRLNMSISKFRGLQYAGRIKGKKCGRIWEFTDENLEEYVAGPADDT